MKLSMTLFVLGFCALSQGVTFTYTNTESGLNQIPLGYEVPIPVDSMTPLDGFRTYDSLNLRHLQMSAESVNIEQVAVGQTFEGNTIWAYQLSDPDNIKTDGELEGSALINSGIHAREWQTPEAATGYMEFLFDNQDDQHLAQYLLENLNLVILPVMNIDGFLQTQRFANQVTSSEVTPRDGRMRRKNMRDVDQDLDSTNDNLLGVDLNRNNAPYWATDNQRSSSDSTSLVHHGTGPASEPESLALQEAAQLAGESRLRLYTDNHSFTQIYYTPLTGNQRRDDIATNVATIMRAANDFKYRFGPSAAGSGIGSTDEYFANTYQIPSYTLEIEPRNSGAEYGGFGPSHSGFILPNSEVSRMRLETTKATMAGLYAIADIPYLSSLEVWDEAQQSEILRLSWEVQQGQRSLIQQITGQLSAQTAYRLKLIFNKPMRWMENSRVAAFSNLSSANGMSLSWQYKIGEQIAEIELDTTNGQWLTEQGISRYDTDTYQLDFVFPADLNWSELDLLALTVDTTDFAGQGLDADPASVVDWQNGAWHQYEDSAGEVSSDTGGIDRSMRLIDDGSSLFGAPPTPEPPPAPAPAPNPVQPDSGSSSGGSILWALILLFVSGLWRTKKASYAKQ